MGVPPNAGRLYQMRAIGAMVVRCCVLYAAQVKLKLTFKALKLAGETD
jgi:hypothetical protein